MKQRFLIDTDIVIDYLRGLPAPAEFIENRDDELLLSSITVAELFAGVKGRAEQASLERFVHAFDVIAVDLRIAQRGGIFRRDFAPAHGTGLADALIAATAELSRSVLVTLNRKHFPMLENVLIPYSK